MMITFLNLFQRRIYKLISNDFLKRNLFVAGSKTHFIIHTDYETIKAELINYWEATITSNAKDSKRVGLCVTFDAILCRWRTADGP